MRVFESILCSVLEINVDSTTSDTRRTNKPSGNRSRRLSRVTVNVQKLTNPMSIESILHSHNLYRVFHDFRA